MVLRYRTLVALFMVVCMVSPIAQTVLSDPTPMSDEGSRSSSFLLWDQKKQITFADRRDVSEDMGIDSEGNLHLVWVNKTGIIRYGKLNDTGFFLAGPREIGSSDRGWDANVRLDVGDTDLVHITWSNNTGPLGAREFHYLKLDKDGRVLVSKAGSGGDKIMGDGDGSIALRFYNNSTPGAPSFGPMTLLGYDSNGDETNNHSVGWHQMGYEHVAWLRLDGGDLIFAIVSSGSAMVYESFDWPNGGGSGTTLGVGSNMSSPKMTFDNSGNIHLFWIDERSHVNYSKSGLYHAVIDENANSLVWNHNIGLGDYEYAKEYAPVDIVITDSKDNDQVAVMTTGYLWGMGGGGDEASMIFNFFTLNTNGTVNDTFIPLVEYCSRPWGDTPVLAQSADNTYYLVWGERMCRPGGNDVNEDLFFMKTRGPFNIDLAIFEDDIVYQDWIFPGEDVTVNFTVRNLGNYNTTKFTVNTTYSDTGGPIGTFQGLLDPNDNMSFEFIINIDAPTNLTFNIDPMDNMDSNLSNNQVNIAIASRLRPDFAITDQNISFSPLRPVPGQKVEITAEVSNLGGLGAEVDVIFRDGMNGTFINKSRMLSETITNTTSIFWTPTTPGLHNIAVLLENSTPSELDRTTDNNFANRTILVGSQAIPTIYITNPENSSEVTKGEVNISGMVQDNDNEDLDISVRVDQSAWEPAVNIANVNWFINWNFTDEADGLHEITARVRDDIHENFFTISINLIPPPPPLIISDHFPKYDPVVNETEYLNLGIYVNSTVKCNKVYRWFINDVMVEDNGKPYQSSFIHFVFDYNDAGPWKTEARVTCGIYQVEHTWNITVLDINRYPVIRDPVPFGKIVVFEGDNVTFSCVPYDPDGDVMEFHWTGMGMNMTTTATNITVKAPSVGNYSMTINVSDGKGGFVDYSWTVEVKKKDIVEPEPFPRRTTRDDPWWILIVIVGIIIIIIMMVVYSKYLRKGTGPDEQDIEVDGNPPSRIG